MIKKVIFFLVVVTFLTACSSVDKNSDLKKKNSVSDPITYLLDDDEYLTLLKYDVSSEKNTNQYQIDLEGNMLLDYRLFTLDNGYVVYVSTGVKQTSENDLVKISGSSQAGAKKLMFINNDFTLIKEIDLSELFKENIEEIVHVAMNSSGNLLAVQDIIGFSIYDIENEEWLDVDEQLNKEQIYEDIAFRDDNTIHYLAIDNNNQYKVGAFDVNQKTYTEKLLSYTPNPIILTTDKSIYFNDVLEARKQKASGKVVSVDNESFHINTYEVDNLESTMSRITPDGKYMVSLQSSIDEATGNITAHHVNVYEINTMKVVNEYDISEAMKASEMYVSNDSFMVVLSAENENKVIAYDIG